jgi:hypothetical protein
MMMTQTAAKERFGSSPTAPMSVVIGRSPLGEPGACDAGGAESLLETTNTELYAPGSFQWQ